MKNQRKAYLYAAFTILAWSTVATAFKKGLETQSSFQLLFGAVVTSFLVLFIYLLTNGKWKEIFIYKPRQYLYSAFLGFLNPFLYYLLLFKAYENLPAQVAQPLNMVWPIILVLISIPLLGQKVSWLSFLALLINFLGVILISSQGGGEGFKAGQVPYMFLALSTSVIWAFFWVLNLKDKRNEVMKLFLNFSFGLFFILIYLAVSEEKGPQSLRDWGYDIYIGLFEMGLTYIFWLKALQFSKTTDRVSNLIFIFPFISLIFIHYILGEKIYLSTLFGLILLVTGIFIQKFYERKTSRLETIRQYYTGN